MTGVRKVVMVTWVPLLILFTMAQDLPAQDRQIDILGYFEPQFAGFDVNDGYQQFSSNKLRVDFAGSYDENLTFAANVNLFVYFGTTTYKIIDYLPDRVVEPLPPPVIDLLSEPVDYLENRTDLDNAYIKMAFHRLDLTVGKQQISPGTGYFWNPTDVLNIKDILDPTYEQPGHNGARVDIPLWDRFNVMLLYNAREDFKQSWKIAGVKVNLGHFDVSITGGEGGWGTINYDALPLADSSQQRTMIGGDFVGELFGLGVWSEAAYNKMELSDDYFEGLAGFDYTFDNELHVLTEFYFNGQGKSDYHEYDVFDWLRYFSGETKTITRAQWVLYAAYPATDLLTIGASTITSLSDGSLVFVPTAAYNLMDNLDIDLFGNIYIGSDGKAYASNLGNGAIIRMRLYF